MPPPALPPMAVNAAPPWTTLFENVDEVTVALPLFSRPPPRTSLVPLTCAWLPLKSVLSTVTVAPASLLIPPPPGLALLAAPPAPPTALFCLKLPLVIVALDPDRIARPPPTPRPALPPAPASPPTAEFDVSLVLLRVSEE